jgi:hypothetical protein
MNFKDLFKRKPGGTTLGNLLRGAAHSFNPLLGNGLMKISDADAAARDAASANGQSPDMQTQVNDTARLLGGAAATTVAGAAKEGMMEYVKKHAAYVVGGVIGFCALIAAIIALTKRGGSKRSRY